MAFLGSSQKLRLVIRSNLQPRLLLNQAAWKLMQQENLEEIFINWMFSNCAGRIGKVAGPLLRRCQQVAGQNLSEADLETLAILRQIVMSAQPRDIVVIHQPRQFVRCYSDASFESNTLRLGWVVFFPSGPPLGGTCVVPQKEIDLWIPRKQQIFVGEYLCGLVVPTYLGIV